MTPRSVGTDPDAPRDVPLSRPTLTKQLQALSSTIAPIFTQAARASRAIAPISAAAQHAAAAMVVYQEHARIRAEIPRLLRSPKTRPLALALAHMYASSALRDLPDAERLAALLSTPLTAEEIEQLPGKLADAAAHLTAALCVLAWVDLVCVASMAAYLSAESVHLPDVFAVPAFAPYQRLALVEAVQTHAPGVRRRLMLVA